FAKFAAAVVEGKADKDAKARLAEVLSSSKSCSLLSLNERAQARPLALLGLEATISACSVLVQGASATAFKSLHTLCDLAHVKAADEEEVDAADLLGGATGSGADDPNGLKIHRDLLALEVLLLLPCFVVILGAALRAGERGGGRGLAGG